MDSPRSLAIFIAIIILAIFYTDIVRWVRPEPVANNAQQSNAGGPPPSANATAGASSATTGIVTNQSPAAAVSNPAASGAIASQQLPANFVARDIVVDTDLYNATFTTAGARLKSFRLKHYRQTVAPESPGYEMVEQKNRRPMGVVIERGDSQISDQGLGYTTDAPGKIAMGADGSSTVTFTAETSDGLKITKTFNFRNGTYVFDLAAMLGDKTAGVTALGLTMSQGLTNRVGWRDIPEIQADIDGKVIGEDQKALLKGAAPVSGNIAFAGFGDRYFLAAFIPEKPIDGSLQMSYAGDEADAIMLFPGALEATSAVYVGPKELGLLEAASPALSKAINFGWTGILALIFLRALQLLHVVAPNYGVDIILVTVAIRLVMLPMSIKSQRSMMRLQRLQPQVQKIRDKFKDDSTRLNREMMELYKRNHVNPLGGCLPMIVQLPVFFGLYEALLNAVELRHAPFIGWIRDLSAPDCFPISSMPKLPFMDCHGLPVLVILMGASTLLQQYMTPASPDPNQQRMMMLMPLMFIVLFVNLPAGLSLYYFASNVLGIIQQFVLNREFRQFTPVTA